MSPSESFQPDLSVHTVGGAAVVVTAAAVVGVVDTDASSSATNKKRNFACSAQSREQNGARGSGVRSEEDERLI